MSLRRVGFTTFAVGLFVGTILLVLDPFVSPPLASCPGRWSLAEFVFRGVQFWPPRVFYSDACSDVALDPSFAVALLLGLFGLVAAAAGHLLEARRST